MNNRETRIEIGMPLADLILRLKDQYGVENTLEATMITVATIAAQFGCLNAPAVFEDSFRTLWKTEGGRFAGQGVKK